MNNLSLFTGSGIGDYAAAQCGIRTVAMCENDPWCCYALERMFPEAKLFKDVHDVSATALRQFGPIDIISGGFPCQNLSTAGRGEGIEGSRSGLWREMFRIIRQVRPAWLVIENVPAIKVRGVDRVLAPLERIGYTCWPLVVGAEHVGAPHRRHRVWIVGRCLADADGSESESGRRNDGEVPEGTTRSCGAADGSAVPPGGRQQNTSLADSIGGPCERGGDEQEREENWGVAAGRAGEDGIGIAWDGTDEFAFDWIDGIGPIDEELADAPSGRHGADGAALGDAGHADQCGESLADSNQEGRQEHLRIARDDGAERTASIRSRWPSRPGEPQHAWEAPRLVERPVGGEFAGMAGRVHSRANKALLRVCGNGWVYQNALLIYQWIAEVETRPSGS